MEVALPLLALSLLGTKAMGTLKYLTSKDWNAVVTQVGSWVIGVGLAFGASAANFFNTTAIPGLDAALQDADSGSKLLLGLVLGSVGSFSFDLKKAFDNTDSAKEPPLLGPANPPA